MPFDKGDRILIGKKSYLLKGYTAWKLLKEFQVRDGMSEVFRGG